MPAARGSYSCKTSRNQGLLGSDFPISSRALCQGLSRSACVPVGFLRFFLAGMDLQLPKGDLKNFRGGYYMTGSFLLFALILKFFRPNPLLQSGRVEGRL